ncbi:hypothetical protein, conserved [Entamoeba dispar SAW760]|uniref:YhhN family protein n=1 Tax=Entamoeba dispar (strain ATCC PRA-260 / SAW760) TaxID=370354 RepID=B0ENF0_ENTDS|nr:uncharacterized protein EDI_294730 [Entamoeba dispar SAW760]EDR23941.1 hypothetical protein, conserved [Entamoeba dispar SAW760]|eukprot:EDR23941.1 hypothetical protein, conserved [Entamoeba dispar SAW760]
MLQWVLFISIITDVLLCWVSYFKKIDSLRVITKPMFCLLLLIFVITSIDLNTHVTLFCVGLFFSFLGDLLLLMDGLQWFACGLVSFLTCHICNIIGYSLTLHPGITLPSFLILLIGCISSIPLMQGAKSKTQKLFTLPVHVYSCGLTGGSFCAFATLGSITGQNWNLLSAWMTAIGYLFFDISDAFLAYHTFVHKTLFSTMAIITTYHIAQLLLMGGLIYNELGNDVISSLI